MFQASITKSDKPETLVLSEISNDQKVFYDALEHLKKNNAQNRILSRGRFPNQSVVVADAFKGGSLEFYKSWRFADSVAS